MIERGEQIRFFNFGFFSFTNKSVLLYQIG